MCSFKIINHFNFIRDIPVLIPGWFTLRPPEADKTGKTKAQIMIKYF